MKAPPVPCPSGSVTFLFTDIEESTHLLSLMGAEYWDLIDQHHVLLRSIWNAHGGFEIDAAGDSFMLAFASADAALDAAADAQRTLAIAEWPMGLPLRVRMGVHSGFAKPSHGHYTGLAVHQTAHLVNAANGRQVLVSAMTRSALGADRQERLSPIGRFRIGDFDAPQILYRLRMDGRLDVALPPHLEPMGHHNLVRPPTRLLDREDALTRLAALVQPGTLVTITGAGGAGKTRVAVELGLLQDGDWADGVWFVRLDSVVRGDRIANAVANALAAPRSTRASALEDVQTYLGDKRLLLILDNCEHLQEACAELAEAMLRRCPNVGILATSQVPLATASETCFALPPLATRTADPDAEPIPPAARLFLDRCPVADEMDPRDVMGLCEHLGGLPYAIELAAARTTAAMPPSRILEQLNDEAAPAPPAESSTPVRHRTLNGVLDWTVAILEPDARQLLFGLAALAGRFDFDLARVAAGAADPELAGVARSFHQLRAHSLIIPNPGGNGFRMPDLVRRYAHSHSAPTAQREAVCALGRHYAQTVGPQCAHRFSWRSRFAQARPNIQGLLTELGAHDPTTAQSLATALCTYALDTGTYADAVTDGRHYLTALPAPSATRAALLVAVCRALMSTGDLEGAGTVLEDAKRLQARYGLPDWAETRVTGQEIVLTLRRGHIDAARRLAHRTLQTARTLQGRAHLYNSLALVEATAGDLHAAVDAEEQALALSTDAGVEVNLQRHHGNLAESYLRLGQPQLGAQHQLQALDLARAHGLPLQVAFSLLMAARIAALRDDPATAVLLNRAGLNRLSELQFVLMASDQAIAEQVYTDAATVLGAAGVETCKAQADAESRAVLEGRAESLLHAASLTGG